MNVLQLCDRYSLSSRKSLYSRLEAAGIKLPKDDDGKAYATEEMISLLDDLDLHIKNGGTLKNYTPVTPVTTYPETFDNGHSLDNTTQTTQVTTHMSREELLDIIEVLGTAIARQLYFARSELALLKREVKRESSSRKISANYFLAVGVRSLNFQGLAKNCQLTLYF